MPWVLSWGRMRSHGLWHSVFSLCPELFQVSVSKSGTMSWVLVFLQGFCPCCSSPLGREECDSVPGLKGKVGLGRAVEQEALGTANIYRT